MVFNLEVQEVERRIKSEISDPNLISGENKKFFLSFYLKLPLLSTYLVVVLRSNALESNLGYSLDVETYRGSI